MGKSHSHSHADPTHIHADHDHSGNDHAHDPQEMYNNAIIIVGIIVFFLIEKITKSCLGVEHSHDHAIH